MAYMPCCPRQLGELGFDPTALLTTIVPKLIPQAGGSAAPSAPMQSPITVSPTLSTQVSPQISPVFQQQFQPSNSAMSAGTAQYVPTSQGVPGSTAGSSPFPDAPSAGGSMPVSFPGNVIPSTDSPSGTVFGIRTGYVVLGAAALIALAFYMKKRRGNSGLRTYRSKSQALAVR